MLDRVNVAAKWSFITEQGWSFSIVTGEDLPPNRLGKHKPHTTHAMCLCVSLVGTLRLMSGRKARLEYICVEHVAAQRSLRNYPADTIKTKPINVDQKVFMDSMRS